MSSKHNPIPAKFSKEDEQFLSTFNAMERAILLEDELKKDRELLNQLNFPETQDYLLKIHDYADLEKQANDAYLEFLHLSGVRPILH